MFKLSMPFVLIAIAACAPVTPVESNASDASAPTEAAEGGQPPSEPAPGVSEGSEGTGEAVPVPDEQIRVGPGLGEAACKPEAAQGLVGRSSGDEVVKDAMRLTGAKAVRVIPHDGVVTMDYRGDRLNIQLDEQGKIVAITCG